MKTRSKPVLTGLLSAALCLSSSSLLAFDSDKPESSNVENKQNVDNQSESKQSEENSSSHKQSKDDHSSHEHFKNIDFDDIDFEDLNISDNPRDGFYLGLSGISSGGDNLLLADPNETEPSFEFDVNYRVQFLGLFFDSPGLSSRRIHSLYASKSWGMNFFNNETWSLDLFYERSTETIEGLKEIQSRKRDKRGGLRATGYFDNSQLQVIFTPYSSNNSGSDGVEASISYGHNWQYRNWNYYANIGMNYRSKEILDYSTTQGYTEIDHDSSTQDGVSHSVEIGLEYPLSEDWVFGSFVAYNALSDRMIENRQDDTTDGYRAGVLLTYVF